jgi:hypothetical protein
LVSFIEEKLLDSVKGVLAGRVNELLGEMEYPLPLIEFGGFLPGGSVVSPMIRLSTCERSEKERIILTDAYSLTVTFTVPEQPLGQGSVGERNCYAYAGAVAAALGEDPTLGGVASRAVLAGKKYCPPDCAGAGADWGVVLTLRLTIEGAGL